CGYPRAASLEGADSKQGVEEAIRALLAAEQRELGGGAAGMFRDPSATQEGPTVAVHVDRDQPNTAARDAWRRATNAALRQPLLQQHTEPPAQPLHSIDARMRPGAAALYALGLMKHGCSDKD
ncbi:hypothetical protein EBZ39_19255, partial [bacterium]|nr:hypothetical protein [bacterium]